MKIVQLIPSIILTLTLVACNQHSIRVQDEDGNNLVGATVLLADKLGGVETYETDTDGRFYISKGGIHVFSILNQGFISQTFRDPQKENINVVLIRENDASDLDGDGLSYSEELSYGTDPDNNDSDGDGIPDGIESKVVSPLALVAFNVTPLHKDILLEIDWVASNTKTKITNLALSIVKSSFRRAPISNPDGKNGIHLVIDHGGLGGGTGLNIEDDWDHDLHEMHGLHMDPDRQAYFYHSFAVRLIEGGAYYGYAQFNNRTSVVTSVYTGIDILDAIVEAGTLQHEIGHNLGLYHGGDDNIVCKPNYPSVMNYSPAMALALDYSSGDRATLNEQSLLETEGIGDGALDWNDNGIIDAEPVAANINHYIPTELLRNLIEILPLDQIEFLKRAFSSDRCYQSEDDEAFGELHDHNDWAVVEQTLPQFLTGQASLQQSQIIIKDDQFEMDVNIIRQIF